MGDGEERAGGGAFFVWFGQAWGREWKTVRICVCGLGGQRREGGACAVCVNVWAQVWRGGWIWLHTETPVPHIRIMRRLEWGERVCLLGLAFLTLLKHLSAADRFSPVNVTPFPWSMWFGLQTPRCQPLQMGSLSRPHSPPPLLHKRPKRVGRSRFFFGKVEGNESGGKGRGGVEGLRG